MIDHTEAVHTASDWQHLSRIRGFQHIWAGRSLSEAPLAVRSVAGELIREYGELIEHLREERQTVIDQLAAYDQDQAARLEGVFREVTS